MEKEACRSVCQCIVSVSRLWWCGTGETHVSACTWSRYTEGKYLLTYGIPDLPKSTGQEKDGEDQGNAAPSIQGETFREIENIYSRTQEKYLDMGHLEILVLGESLLMEGVGSRFLSI